MEQPGHPIETPDQTTAYFILFGLTLAVAVILGIVLILSTCLIPYLETRILHRVGRRSQRKRRRGSIDTLPLYTETDELFTPVQEGDECCGYGTMLPPEYTSADDESQGEEVEEEQDDDRMIYGSLPPAYLP
jgi:hypothetical protein